ncbi:MAG TPA: lamin tail domain-containing protein, partial [Ruminococcus flavefaciens]|nr:lamin tail domain-containing protein [Ruminococcus flavefaciens]
MKELFRRTAAGVFSFAVLAGLIPAVPASAAGSVTINEVCTKNTTYAAPDGGFYDWVELYNNSSSAVDISGWGLSDKDSNPYRFTFPQGTSV